MANNTGRSSRCSCRHESANGSAIPGSGTATDPYSHETARFINIKNPNNNNVVLTINDNNCVILPRSVRRVLMESTGRALEPNSSGHIPWPDFLNSFSIEATPINYANITTNQTRITGVISPETRQQLTITSIGTTESGTTLLGSGDPIGSVLQGAMTFQEQPFAVSVPQLRTSSNFTNEIDYPFSQIVTTGGTPFKVELWPSGRLLAINQNSTAVCHVKFSMRFGPAPAAGYDPAAHARFRIYSPDTPFVGSHTGYFTPELPRIKTFSYFLPVTFTSASAAQGNGTIELAILSQEGMPTTSSMVISDILVSYTLM